MIRIPRELQSRTAAAWLAAGLSWALPAPAPGVEIESSPPVGTTISIYDRGFALVSELRRLTLVRGENQVRIRQLPAGLDPASVTFTALAGAGTVSLLEQRFAYDLGDASDLYHRYLGEGIEVAAAGEKLQGILVAAPGTTEELTPASPLALRSDDGSATVLSGEIDYVRFPNAAAEAFLEPTLLWTIEADQEGPRNLRLTYAAERVEWGVSYECMMNEEGNQGYLGARAVLRNLAGGRFENARVRLAVSEMGQSRPLFEEQDGGRASGPPLRYAYGAAEPTFERLAASPGSLHTYEIPRPVTMEKGQTLHVLLASAPAVPLTRIFVYDGVRYDRFQRNRRNDWNYGTEFHTVVETHVEFLNDASTGLGMDLPAGRFRLYRAVGEEGVDLIGEASFQGVAAGEAGQVLVGPARGLRGERERIGYSEVTPLHEYEETFEIRLANDSGEDVEIRVVEHLYRWPEFQIVRADTEYTQTGSQTIEFRPLVKNGGKRSVHYTVRYSW